MAPAAENQPKRARILFWIFGGVESTEAQSRATDRHREAPTRLDSNTPKIAIFSQGGQSTAPLARSRPSAPSSWARLLCAQAFPRRLEALEFEAAHCHHPNRHCRRQASRGLLPCPQSVASFASSPPAESANKAGKKGCGGRETTPTVAPTATQTPALPLPTRPIEPSLYRSIRLGGGFNAMDGWSSRVGPVGSGDAAVFR